MLKLKLEQEVNTMTLEDLMKIIPESEANAEYLADKFIKRVNENQYPIIEMRDKIARRIMDERTNEVGEDDSVLRESDFDFSSILGDEFVIRLTKFGWPTEYLYVEMAEENGRTTISNITVIGNHLPDEPKTDDKMRCLLYFKPSIDRRDYSNVDFEVANVRTVYYQKYGYETPKQEADRNVDYAMYYYIKTVLALSFFSEKCRNQTKVVANSIARGGSNTMHREDSIKNTSPNVVRIDDVTVIYPNSYKGERTFTRHTESWLVRGHYRHYKSGKVIAIKPFVKGDRSVPVQNKVYQVV